MKAYYARPMSIYGTNQETRDKITVGHMGCEVLAFPDQATIEKYGMEAFKPVVEQADVLFFRAFPDGSISAGVGKEIAWAQSSGIPVFELPRMLKQRTLSIDDTVEYLKELGQR